MTINADRKLSSESDLTQVVPAATQSKCYRWHSPVIGVAQKPRAIYYKRQKLGYGAMKATRQPTVSSDSLFYTMHENVLHMQCQDEDICKDSLTKTPLLPILFYIKCLVRSQIFLFCDTVLILHTHPDSLPSLLKLMEANIIIGDEDLM